MQTLRDPINERSSRTLNIPLADQDGAALEAATVSTLTASLRDVASGTLIRTAQNVKNANGGTLTDGLLRLVLSPTDTQAIGTASLQPRLLTLDLLTVTSLRITEEIQFVVRSLVDITT